ncbi:hypothetical protein MASR1M12_37010 [Erysipelotrichia bacterium]
MNVYHYPETDTLYFRLSSMKSLNTVEIAGGVLLSLGSDGTIVGIEIKNISNRADFEKLKPYLPAKDFSKPESGYSTGIVSESALDYASAGAQSQIIVIGGPNGAGKSTSAPEILQGALRVDEFVNADTIAHGLSAFRPEKAAIKAGRVMLARLQELASQKMNFAFETTLSSRSFAPWIKELKRSGYKFSILFFWLESPQLAVNRVAERVMNGGHHVPEDVVKRRYEAGLANFFRFYQPVADHWEFFDNSNAFEPVLVACSDGDSPANILVPRIWEPLKEKYL